MRLATYSSVKFICVIVVAALVGFIGVRYLLCVSKGSSADDKARSETVIENFGTGLDLLLVSYKDDISTPPNLRLVKEDKIGGIRGIYFEDCETGEGVQLILRPDGHENLGIGMVSSLSGAPKLKTLRPSAFATSRGITLGASLEEVIAEYGKSQPLSHPQMPDFEFIEYESKLPAGLVSILGFAFKQGTLVGMNSILYSPTELEEWRKKIHYPEKEWGQKLKTESEVKDSDGQ